MQPLIVLGYSMFYLAPYFPGGLDLETSASRRGPETFVWRHPLISLSAIILPLGFLLDAMLEISAVRTGTYIYSQVIPFGFALRRYTIPVSSPMGVLGSPW